ncbi:MAG TPA: helix-turn-helix transcriptional regulator [Solirubrobacteraceae bacterium]|nr:helix-turn-helix transcriptional regulator [Solirubrobacteraceae bacterium]
MDDDRAVGKRVAAARRIAGLQRAQLAERINTPKLGDKNVGRIERGERRLEPHEAPLFADALGVPVSFFYEPLEAADDDDSARLARIEAKLEAAEQAREDLAAQIAQQNENLARQSEILERIESLVGVLQDVDIEVSEPPAAARAPTDEIPAPPDLPAPPAVEPIRRRGARGTPRSA